MENVPPAAAMGAHSEQAHVERTGMSRLRTQHAGRVSGCGPGSRTASRRWHERVAQAVKTTAATLSIRFTIALRHEPPARPAWRACLRRRPWERTASRRTHERMGLSRLRTQHAGRASGCVQGSRTASRRRHERVTQAVKPTAATLSIRLIIDLPARAACAPSLESIPPASAMGAHCEQAHVRTHGQEPPAHPARRA